MGKIAKKKLAMTDSLRIYGGSFFAHLLSEILTKHNIKETASKGNIRGTIYHPKVRVHVAVEE